METEHNVTYQTKVSVLAEYERVCESAWKMELCQIKKKGQCDVCLSNQV